MKLMVLDGNSIINRAYYGIRPLTTKDGFYTHAIFGFLTTLQRLLDEEAPEAVCVAFDRREPTFRHKADENYKATRREMPEELAMQLPVLKDVLDAMSIRRYELAGYEADDLIGTISRRCEAAGWECTVVTGDKDSLQLITEHTKVKLVSTRMGQTTTRDMTQETFTGEYGFAPIHMIDLKALMGDASDNIPGVPGIGEKTATALVREYQSIDALYAKMPDVHAKPAVLKKLADGEQSARHSHWLATIVTDAPLKFAPEENIRKAYQSGLYDLFLKLEFNKLIEKYGLKPAAGAQAEPQMFEGTCTMTEVLDPAGAESAARELRSLGRTVCIFAPTLDKIAFHGDADEDAVAYILRRDTFRGDYGAALRVLFDADLPKAGHNIKDLQRELLGFGVEPEGWVFDSALAAYLADATAGNYDLYWLCAKYCGFKPWRAGENGAQEQLSLLDAPDVSKAEENAELASAAAGIACLEEALRPRLAELNMTELYETAELPLCAVLARMEHRGVRVDSKALAGFGSMLDQELAALETRIYELAGGSFNINSPKQLGTVLFERLHLPHGKKTKTGWSTNADVLDKLKWENPIVADVLQYRQYAKFKSTYCDGLAREIASDGRIHTNFQMTVTATGRLSSTEPNLQNIPTRTQLGSEFRRMFIPDSGCVLVDADYSQIELRLLAHIADDETMRAAFNSGEDIHTVTASQVFGVPAERVTKQMRANAKAVNFGIVYGISAFSLSQDIGVSVADAKAYIESYLMRFSGVRRYMTDVVEQAKARGYVETVMHRRRNLPELTAANFATRSFGERVALNMPIQGTAADIMKLAMVRVDRRLRAEGLRGRLVLQVHDELLVECPEEEAQRVAELLTEEMQNAAQLSVPLTAEAHCGKNWLEAKG